MKKTLVAIASLAAVSAFAQSSVSITGNIDAGFQANTYKGVNVSGIANNGASTSTIQLNGVEDLGGGLRATFKLNSDFNPTAGQGNAGYGGVATGQSAGITSTTGVAGSSGSWLNSEMKFGLAGGFGEIYTGVVNNLTLDAGGTGNPFGTAIGSGFRALYNTDVIGILVSRIGMHDHDEQLNQQFLSFPKYRSHQCCIEHGSLNQLLYRMGYQFHLHPVSSC